MGEKNGTTAAKGAIAVLRFQAERLRHIVDQPEIADHIWKAASEIEEALASAPQPPAEAQAQVGGDVCEVCDGGPGNDGPCLCGISAPPSAPVGEWAREEAAALRDRLGATTGRMQSRIETLEQSAPVGVDVMDRAMDAYRAACAEWRKNPDNRDEPEAMFGVRAVVEALAQQPAAVDGEVFADYKCAACSLPLHSFADDWTHFSRCGCGTAEKVRTSAQAGGSDER